MWKLVEEPWFFVAMIQDRLLLICSENKFLIHIKQELSRFPIYFTSQITTVDYPASRETIKITAFLLLSAMADILTLPLVI